MNRENRRPRAVVFDLWDTLAVKGIPLAQSLAVRLSIRTSPDYEVKYEKAIQTQRWASTDDLAQGFLSAFGLPATRQHITIVKDTLQEGIDGAVPIPGIDAVLKLLRYKIRLALLSNTTNFEAHALERLHFAEYFEHRIWSWETGVLKPDLMAFQIASDRLDVSPGDMLIVDDAVDNITAASTLGMCGIRFTSTDALRTNLSALDIIH